MKNARVILADVNEVFLSYTADYLKHCGNIEIVGSCKSGSELLSLVKSQSPDAVILNLILEDIDGITVLRKLSEASVHLPIIVCTEICSEHAITCAQRYGASLYLCKPVILDSLYSAVCECTRCLDHGVYNFVQPETETDFMIMDRLALMGISADCMGYSLIVSAVRHASRDPEILTSMSKKLYPLLARLHNTTVSRAERNIRSAIRSAHERGMLNDGGQPPTNKQLISSLIAHIKNKIHTL